MIINKIELLNPNEVTYNDLNVTTTWSLKGVITLEFGDKLVMNAGDHQ